MADTEFGFRHFMANPDIGFSHNMVKAISVSAMRGAYGTTGYEKTL